MLAVAAQLDLVPCLLAVIAAVFPVGSVGRHQALTRWMSAFRSGIGHDAPSPHSTLVSRSRAIRLICAWVALVACAVAAPDAAQRPGSSVDLAETLARVGQRVEQWYARARTVMSTETVWIQPLRSDLTPADVPRRLAFELRVAWDPDRTGPDGRPVANVLREPVGRNGRSSREPKGADCMDPKPVSPEPLAMLLPARLAESEFSAAGAGRVDRRPALMLDYQGRAAGPPEITWTDACVTVTLPGRSKGRIWVDAANYDVLRMDDRLVGVFEFDVPREHVRRGAAPSMVIERAESSTRYKRVEFQDPQETLMVPAAIDTLTVIRGGSTQRVRITQRFSDYRRFLTGGRIVD